MRPVIPRWLNAVTFLHALLTAVMAAMAIQLILPTETYSAGTAPGAIAGNWRVISHYIGEKALGCLLWMVACYGLVGMLATNRSILISSSVALGLAHGVMAAFFVVSNPAGIGSILLSGYAIAAAYLVMRRIMERSA